MIIVNREWALSIYDHSGRLARRSRAEKVCLSKQNGYSTSIAPTKSTNDRYRDFDSVTVVNVAVAAAVSVNVHEKQTDKTDKPIP